MHTLTAVMCTENVAGGGKLRKCGWGANSENVAGGQTANFQNVKGANYIYI